MAKINPKTATKYHGDIPKLFIEHCKAGKSTAEFCKENDISYATFKVWCNTYPDLTRAKTDGKKIAEAWWVEQAQKHLVIVNTPESTTKFDTSLYKFIMSGRFGHTSDRAMAERIAELEQKLAAMHASAVARTAYAEIAECEPDDNNKTQ